MLPPSLHLPGPNTIRRYSGSHLCPALLQELPMITHTQKGKMLNDKNTSFFPTESKYSELKEVVETEFAAVKENNRRKCWTSVDNETGRHECISGLTLHFMNKLIHSYRVGVGATRMHSTMMNISKTKKNHYYCHRSYRILVKLSLGS